MVSEAARQLPEEVYKVPAKAETGEEKQQGRTDRKRRRAASKRQFKKRESQVITLHYICPHSKHYES